MITTVKFHETGIGYITVVVDNKKLWGNHFQGYMTHNNKQDCKLMFNESYPDKDSAIKAFHTYIQNNSTNSY